MCATLILAAMMMGTVSHARVPPPDVSVKADASIIGVWRAEEDGFPFVTLTIRDEGGSLSGAVLFYLHRRNPGQPVTSTPGVPEPLLNASFDGTTLAFKVSHKSAHPPATLSDPPVSFRLKLVGPDKAELMRGDDTSSNFVLTRSE
jgi:hypothetical protein